MALTLSLNTNPLVNRFAEPEELIQTIAQRIRIRDVQLTHEFINPGWPAATINQMTRRMKKALQETGVRVTSGMTGPYGRLNHFGLKPLPISPPNWVVIRWARSSPFLPCEIIRISPAATR